MRILIVDDQRSIRLAVLNTVRASGHEAETADSGLVAILKLQAEHYDCVLLDLRLDTEADGLDYLARLQKMYPQLPVIIFTAHASIITAVEAMRRGAHDYLEKPFTPEQLRQLLTRIERTQRLRQRVQELEEQVAHTQPTLNFTSDDAAMVEVLSLVERAAQSRATILLLGENGTGKSALARHIHHRSPSAAGPFTTVSCPSLSLELLESELFGHVAGAFTGASRDTWGKVEAARGGTLFLDEIGELPMALQAKLLRLLQERSYERVGETKTRTADVRVIAATNRDLAAAVKAKVFREDLFYRLNVISVVVPPLRERPHDLERHAQRFLEFFAADAGRPLKEFSEEAWQAIRRYRWPGNLRDLRNSIERAVILARGDKIGLDDLPAEIGAAQTEIALGAFLPLETIEREHIRLVSTRTATLREAAGVLGINTATIYRKRQR